MQQNSCFRVQARDAVGQCLDLKEFETDCYVNFMDSVSLIIASMRREFPYCRIEIETLTYNFSEMVLWDKVKEEVMTCHRDVTFR